MGLVGAALISRWAWGLLVRTGRLLLDAQSPKAEAVRSRLEEQGDEVLDLHLWSIGPGLLAAEVVVVSEVCSRWRRAPHDPGVTHRARG